MKLPFSLANIYRATLLVIVLRLDEQVCDGSTSDCFRSRNASQLENTSLNDYTYL